MFDVGDNTGRQKRVQSHARTTRRVVDKGATRGEHRGGSIWRERAARSGSSVSARRRGTTLGGVGGACVRLAGSDSLPESDQRPGASSGGRSAGLWRAGRARRRPRPAGRLRGWPVPDEGAALLATRARPVECQAAGSAPEQAMLQSPATSGLVIRIPRLGLGAPRHPAMLHGPEALHPSRPLLPPGQGPSAPLWSGEDEGSINWPLASRAARPRLSRVQGHDDTPALDSKGPTTKRHRAVSAEQPAGWQRKTAGTPSRRADANACACDTERPA